jgi:arabinoxylan arabinofuranohydrolase
MSTAPGLGRRRNPPRSAAPTAVLALLTALLVARPARADYPIASHRYLADPGALVHNGRVYLYNSNDDDNPEAGGYEMKSFVCVSSADLKNWTDHGEVLRVPADASWAGYAWAPYAVERNGKIFLYFGNNANGIGVASSTTPTGRFKDAKGSALIDSRTPGASGNSSWLFDPGGIVDDDGQAYIYFGGNGMTNARVIKINADMISVSGSAIGLSPPNFFEASFMHKRNGIYYFSYSTNSSAGLRIDYMTSNSPTSGFTYKGTIGPQPPSNGNNNHASEFEFGGNWYHAYHNRYVAMQAGISPTYRRSLGLERFTYNADGTIVPVTYTMDGLTQLAPLNPYERVEAETFNAQNGIETEVCSAGGMDVTQISNGDWVKLRGVDFGVAGAKTFQARVASSGAGGSIELRLGSATGTLVGTCTVPGTGGAQSWSTVMCDVTGATGVKDLTLKFTGGNGQLFNFDYWQFTGGDGGAGGAGGGTGTAGAGGSVAGAGGAGARGGAGGISGGAAGASGRGGVSGSAGLAGASGPGGGGAGGAGIAGAGGPAGAGVAGSGPAGASGGGTAGAGVGLGGSAGSAVAGSAGQGAPAGGAPGTDDGAAGCSCTTTGGPGQGLGGLLLLALAAVGRRRRRQGRSGPGSPSAR